MSEQRPLREFQFFHSDHDYSVTWRRLPHWAQAGTVCFITWRTADSLPEFAVRRLFQRRRELLALHGFDARSDWKQTLAAAPIETREQLHWSFFHEWDHELDEAAGACWLQHAEVSLIVMNSLRYFDDDRYLLTDAVIMPNHVHLMVAFRSDDAILKQCTSWKRYTATQINRWLISRAEPTPRDGSFWQVDQFDHLVRSEEYFLKFRRYLLENPQKARLKPEEFRHYSRP